MIICNNKTMKRTSLLLVLVLPVLLACSANAITYQDGTDVQFTFNSTLSISLSDTDLIIGNLIPGQDDLSNAVDVVVNTNNLYGYTLTATVGDTNHDYRDLRHTNGTTNIVSINVDSDLSTLTNESTSSWGYTVSTNGTTWSNYNGLPKYDDTQNTAELNTTDGTAANSTTSFKISAFAAEGQLAGDYSNVINFKVVSNGAPPVSIATGTTMQGISPSSEGGCPVDLPVNTIYQLEDTRDHEVYNVAKLVDGNCWMLDNLRLGGDTQVALSPNDTNINFNFTLTAGESGDYRDPLVHTNGSRKYTELSYGDGMGKSGTFYNYCAASAGTICDGSEMKDAEYDICPKGWRMPTDVEFLNLRQDLLDGAYNQEAVLRARNTFHVTLTGRSWNGNVHDQGSSGFIWASTRRSVGRSDAYLLLVQSSTFNTSIYDLHYQQTVRCVLK